MKRLLYTVLLLIFPVAVYAESINLNCPAEVNSGGEFECEITGNSSYVLVGVEGTYSVSGLNVISFTPSSKWQGDGNSDNKFGLYTADDITGDFSIGTLKFKSVSDSNNVVTIDNVTFATTGNEYHPSSVTKEITVIKSQPETTKKATTTKKADTSNNNSTNKTDNSNTENNDDDQTIGNKETGASAYLSNLVVKGYELNFYKEVYEYTLKINDEKNLVIQPFLEDSESSYKIIGNENLADGSVISVVVTSSTGDIKTYKLTIQKETKKGFGSNLIFIGIIVILVIINIVRIVLNKKKANGGE